MTCPKCGSDAHVKNGFVKGIQRFKCKSCGCQFTRDTPHGYPAKIKILALILCLCGVPMRAVGQVLGVSGQSVMRWVKIYGNACREELENCKIAEEEIEIDEMHHFIEKKTASLGVENTWSFHSTCARLDLWRS